MCFVLTYRRVSNSPLFPWTHLNKDYPQRSLNMTVRPVIVLTHNETNGAQARSGDVVFFPSMHDVGLQRTVILIQEPSTYYFLN